MNKTYIKIIINGTAFLLPQPLPGRDYEFPGYILDHKPAILEHIEAGEKFALQPMNDHFSTLPDLSEFRRRTGIIGWPLTAHDANLYAIDKGIEIVLEITL